MPKFNVSRTGSYQFDFCVEAATIEEALTIYQSGNSVLYSQKTIIDKNSAIAITHLPDDFIIPQPEVTAEEKPACDTTTQTAPEPGIITGSTPDGTPIPDAPGAPVVTPV